MTPTDWAILLIPLAGWIPGVYFLWLNATKGAEYARKKTHQYDNNEYRQTDAGAIAIDDERWIVYLYRE